MKKIVFLSFPVVFFCLAAASSSAEVTLPKMLSSHMVLQRDHPIHLWGWADPGEQVTVSLHGATASAKADGLGHWSIYLPPEQAGGPYQVTIAGTNTIVLDDVMIGDVWFASGQSNMQLPLMGFPGSAVVINGDEEIRNATHPELRLLHIPDKATPYPQQDQPASWTLCTPETAASFSAAAYFFGREIAQREHVTVGLIDSTWGGTPGEAWISMDSIGSDAALMPVFAEWARASDDDVDYPRIVAEYKREDAAALAAHHPAPDHPWRPDSIESWEPAWLYNGMIAPAINYPIKGVIWYQGEANTSPVERAPMYQRIFPALITDWRKHWQEGNFPFLFVQISSYTASPIEDWAIVREAQRRTLSLANTTMAVTIDIGNPTNVHPADKQDVGHRLALAARALVYGEQIEYSGPDFRQISIVDGHIHVWFDHAASGLVAKAKGESACPETTAPESTQAPARRRPSSTSETAQSLSFCSKGGPLNGFEIAGPDRKFVPATASIDKSVGGESVDVSSPQVSDPKYVRYGWANYPEVNLFNGAGLPASPFTSEENIPKR